MRNHLDCRSGNNNPPLTSFVSGGGHRLALLLGRAAPAERGVSVANGAPRRVEAKALARARLLVAPRARVRGTIRGIDVRFRITLLRLVEVEVGLRRSGDKRRPPAVAAGGEGEAARGLEPRVAEFNHDGQREDEKARYFVEHAHGVLENSRHLPAFGQEYTDTLDAVPPLAEIHQS